jgi:hypothetical protein
MASVIVSNAVPATIITSGTRRLLRDDLEGASGDLDICHPFTDHRTEKPYPRDAHRYGAHTGNGTLIGVTSPLTPAIRTVLPTNGGTHQPYSARQRDAAHRRAGETNSRGLNSPLPWHSSEHALQFVTRSGEPLSASSTRTAAAFFPNRRARGTPGTSAS